MNPINSQDKLIVNLSSSTLSIEQRAVLLRGLSFVPTPQNVRTQKLELLQGLHKYHRRLKLETFFRNKTE